MNEPNTAQEGYIRGFHGIPDDDKLGGMSFAELASELPSAKDSPKFLVIDREMKRRLAKDQAIVSRSNVILGALLAGSFGLAGVVLGWSLRGHEPSQKPTAGGSVQEGHQTNLGIKPPD